MIKKIVTYKVYITCHCYGHPMEGHKYFKTITIPERQVLSGIKFINWDNFNEMYAKYKRALPFRCKECWRGKKLILSNGDKIKQWKENRFSILLKFEYEPVEVLEYEY